MGEVDPAFIQDPQHRPKLSIIQPEHIPVIDLSPITNNTVSDPSSIEGLVKEIGNACKEWGFFQPYLRESWFSKSLSYLQSTSESSLAKVMGEVDPAFIQDPQHRPKFSTIQPEDIPVIDLSPITNHTLSDSSSIENLVKEIGSACKEWGFFQVTNHGVPLTLRQNIEIASRLFFAQSLEEKRKVSKSENNTLGYHDTEHTKNIRDWKEVFDFLARDPTFIPLTSDEHDDRLTQLTNQSPEYPPNFRVIIQEYIQEMEKLCFKLLELIALSLGIEANRFEEFFIKNQTSSIRLNHYPPCPYPGLALGVGRHKDPGALTILAQDEVGGLEVKRKADQEWIGVKPTLDAYIINVGDIIQVWSNDAYESVEHRVVVNSEKERFSIPFFFYPAHETEVKPLEELINEQNPSKYRPYKWGKFITHRKNTNFKNQNVENIQIYHYKLA
ncbi:hypothetical protein JHK85_004215 [Glycine max]|nr:hypothetical protein JHK85_004215 [Glycine max]KAG5079980.1 hypothetical protein JHK86_004045 [Glycine max]